MIYSLNRYFGITAYLILTFDIENGKENHEIQVLTKDCHVLKAYQAFTAPEVISAAADVYLKNFTSSLT